MILKNKDGRQTDVQELNRLLTLKPTAKQRFLIERELKCLVSGERNEQNSACYGVRIAGGATISILETTAAAVKSFIPLPPTQDMFSYCIFCTNSENCP